MAIDLDVHGNTKPLEAAVQAAVNRIRRQPIKITIDDKGATQPLGNMKRGADEFTKSMEAANARILAFGASMAIINGVGNAFKGMVKNLVEVEKSLADINVVMGLSAQNLDKFSDGLFKVAKETGAAFRVAADAATEYARQGLGVEESLKRTRDALVLTRLTGMDSAEAVKSLTAAMNTYGNQIKDTTQLVSKFAAVDVKFAVSAEDFADAISRTGQSAKTAGVSIDELVGIVTSAQQQTARGGAVIGNALKTIFTKTGRTDTLNQLENLGIAVRDLEGNTLGAKRILSDLANTFDKLSEAQKAQITQTMGGLFHINILKAVLSDAAKQNGIMAEATRISAGATDEAIQKNEELRKTMSAVATETGLAIKQVSAQIGEIALAPGMEKILNTVKSLAEGLSGVLGDGETTGSSFATGFLKGIGNVITGPGLVVLAGVFFKLFGQALKFTKESLTSLVGVTTEKQKQKAIQTSLVALFGQNAALNKEMLRTDIGRTEKEKIILGLLKAQVVEANALNKLTAGMAGTLYRKGYGANLTPIGKKASGHIPNFANPERAQAARGGYAAGSIRSMNMPGEGPVIYNSAETVKNFAGFKQPAIMPPQSSKAGKNYQQAFGDIHGFDPYAAGGYIPNFAQTYNADSKMVLFAGSAQDGGGYTGPDRKKNIIYINPSAKSGDKKFSATKKTGMKAVNVPYFTIGKDDKEREANDPKIKNKIQGDLIKQAQKTSNQLVNSLFKMPSIPSVITSSDVAVASGKIFEKIIMSVQKGVAKEAYGVDPPGNALLDIPRPGRDALWDLFGAGPLGSLGAEAKIALGSGGDAAHLKSAAEKFYRIDSYEGIGGAKAMAFAPKGQVSQKNLASLGYTSELQDYINKRGQEGDPLVPAQNSKRTFASWPKGKYGNLERLKNDFYSKARAYGHIPNFADPLSDAIGREKAAGVPVSQIRVGSHSALMSKGNPLGLGVTNTHDEPNGLRDVFGANGFVPNYAAQFQEGDFSKGSWAQNRKYLNKANRMLASWTSKLEEGLISKNQYNKYIKMASRSTNDQAKVSKRVIAESKKYTTSMGRAGNYLKTLSQGYKDVSKSFSKSGAGKFFNSNGAQMGLMIGAPMLGGMLQQGGPEKGGFGFNTGGALVGAATGASMGMIFGPLGIAVGGAVGAIVGWTGAVKESNQAVIEKNRREREEKKAGFVTTGVDIFSGRINPGQQIGNVKGLEEFQGKTMLEVFESIPRSYGEANKKLREEQKKLQGTSQEKAEASKRLEKKYGMGSAELAFSKQQALITAMSGREKEVFRGKEKLEKFGIDKETATGAEIMTAIKSADAKELDALFNALKIMMQGSAKTEKESAATAIRQLNMRKAMLRVQGQIDQNLNKIKESSMMSQMNFKWIEAFGYTGNELVKSQITYSKALSKASNDLELQQEQLKGEAVTGIFNQLNSSTNQANLKNFLTKDGGANVQNLNIDEKIKKELERLSKKTGVVDLTQAFSGLNYEQLIAVLDEMAKADTNIKIIRDQIVESYDKENQKLQNNYDLTTKTAEENKKLNDAIGKRVELYKALNREAEYQDRFRDLDNQKTDANNRLSDLRWKNANRYATELALANRELKELQRNSAQDLVDKEAEMTAETIDRLISKYKELGITIDEAKFQKVRGMGRLSGISIENLGLEQSLYDKEDIPAIKAAGAKEIDDRIEAVNASEDPREKARLNQEINELHKKQMELNSLMNVQDESKLELLQGELKNLDQELTSKKEILDTEEKITQEKIKQKKESLDMSFGAGFKQGIADLQNEIDIIDKELGRNVPRAFADGLAGAMTEAINGTKSIKEGLTDAAISFLGMIQEAMMKKMVYQMVGLPFSQGGNVRNYSRGGGVPAMVSNGEYVMGRDAVAKYGGAFMHGMNAGGRIPGFAGGGSVEQDLLARGKIRREGAPGGPAAQGSALAANFGGGRGFDSGRLYQRRAMSGAFYAQSGNVGLAEDTSAIQSILSEEERRRQEAEAKRQAKKAKRRQLLGMVLGTLVTAGLSSAMQGGNLTGTAKAAGYGANTPAGVNMAIDSSGMAVSTLPGADMTAAALPISAGGSGLTNITPTRSFNPLSWGSPSTINPALAPFFYNQEYLGGPIRKYASGGHIAGKSGIDQIPAMLSEGEYVIRASSARQIGRPMLDRINAGKFYDGGAVSEIAGSSETGSTGGNTNNINISINMERGSSNQKQQKENESSGVNPADASSDEKNNSELAERIKQQVVSVIMEEQRPGGLLSD